MWAGMGMRAALASLVASFLGPGVLIAALERP